MKIYKLDNTSSKNKLFFGFIADGNKSIRSIKKIAGCDTPTAKLQISELIELGYIDENLEVIVDRINLCKMGFVKVNRPEKLNLKNWVSSTYAAIVSSMRRSKIPASTKHAMTWMGKTKDKKLPKLIQKPSATADGFISDLAVPEVIEVKIKPPISKIKQSDNKNNKELYDSILLGLDKDDIEKIKEIERICIKKRWPATRLEIKNIYTKEAMYSGARNPIAFTLSILDKKYDTHKRQLDALCGEKPSLDKDTIMGWFDKVKDATQKTDDQIGAALTDAVDSGAKNPVGYAIWKLKGKV